MTPMPLLRILPRAALLALTGCQQYPLPSAMATPLAWAYPQGPNAPLPKPPPGPITVPGSARRLTLQQASDDRNPPDWFPAEHPPAPPIVAHARDAVTPCAECHLFNGQGFIGSGGLAGLSRAYIVEQVHEFRDGRRTSSQKDRQDTLEMIKVARGVTEAELESAAAWFAALPRRPWFRVVEAARVPVTTPSRFGWLDLAPGNRTEPIAGRIIEVPENTLRTFLGDPHSGVVDYAPPGAIARGAALVASGGGGGTPCAECHGAGLHGLGDVPPLAGRGPAYLARMLWDIRSGARHGTAVALMQVPAKGLGEGDIRDVAAYLGSLTP